MATPAVPPAQQPVISTPSRFRSRESVVVAADDRLVRLDFTNSQPRVSLYAHPWVLSSWSKVLNNVLEDAANRAADATGYQQQQAESGIPIDDADPTAWEEALSLMYPSVPLFAISSANAARLLALADKYDMPCLAEHVRSYLSSNLQGLLAAEQAHGQPSSAYFWFHISSRFQLQQQVQVCIQHIVSNNLRLPAGFLGSIPAADAEQLVAAMQQQITDLRVRLAEATRPPVVYSGDTSFNSECGRAVLGIISQHDSIVGMHVQQIYNALLGRFTPNQIDESLRQLTANAHLYTTTDDDHYKAA